MIIKILVMEKNYYTNLDKNYLPVYDINHVVKSIRILFKG